MTGWRRANCNCCTTVPCGISNTLTSAFCGGSTGDTECPSTLSVSVSFPERQVIIACNDPPPSGPLTCFDDRYTLPAFTGSTAVCKSDLSTPHSCTFPPASCYYWGKTELGGSINLNCGSQTYTNKTLEVFLMANTFGVAGTSSCDVLFYACGEDGPDYCCGVVVKAREIYTNSGSEYVIWSYSMRYYLKSIDSCSDECPCFTWAGGTPVEWRGKCGADGCDDCCFCPDGLDEWNGLTDCPQSDVYPCGGCSSANSGMISNPAPSCTIT